MVLNNGTHLKRNNLFSVVKTCQLKKGQSAWALKVLTRCGSNNTEMKIMIDSIYTALFSKERFFSQHFVKDFGQTALSENDKHAE